MEFLNRSGWRLSHSVKKTFGRWQDARLLEMNETAWDAQAAHQTKLAGSLLATCLFNHLRNLDFFTRRRPPNLQWHTDKIMIIDHIKTSVTIGLKLHTIARDRIAAARTTFARTKDARIITTVRKIDHNIKKRPMSGRTMIQSPTSNACSMLTPKKPSRPGQYSKFWPTSPPRCSPEPDNR